MNCRAVCCREAQESNAESANGAERNVRGKSAEGAQYDSQGQARSEASASPLVCDKKGEMRPERPKYYYALSGL